MKTIHTFPLLIATIFLFTGCARTGNFGTLQLDDEIRDAFETAAVAPDHTYYYTGPQAQPDAIMAIDKQYKLANKKNYWIRVNISEKMLRDWNMIIQNEFMIKYPYRGARILTPAGKRVGLWYSRHKHTTVKFPAPGEVIIYTPALTPRKHFKPNPFMTRHEE